jgi:ribonuclease Z
MNESCRGSGDFTLRPVLHPKLVNGRFGDPALFVEVQFEKHAVLFDLGDLTALPARKIQRLDHVFVSHTHIDHFIGFDRLLRILVGREKTLHLYGPAGFIEQVCHKLHAYRWNLADRYESDLVFMVTEISHAHERQLARFRLSRAFEKEEVQDGRHTGDLLVTDSTFHVRTAILEHRTPCLGFAIEEPIHVNVWKNRLAELGLPVGPWLNDLKRFVLDDRPDDHLVKIWSRAFEADIREVPLGLLRSAVKVTPGQKIGYVTDVADTPLNRDLIVDLVRHADLLFIEAPFAAADSALAAARAHLTTTAAGEIGRQAGVRRVEPFHFSPRYEGGEKKMIEEVMTAFERTRRGAP